MRPAPIPVKDEAHGSIRLQPAQADTIPEKNIWIPHTERVSFFSQKTLHNFVGEEINSC